MSLAGRSSCRKWQDDDRRNIHHQANNEGSRASTTSRNSCGENVTRDMNEKRSQCKAIAAVAVKSEKRDQTLNAISVVVDSLHHPRHK